MYLLPGFSVINRIIREHDNILLNFTQLLNKKMIKHKSLNVFCRCARISNVELHLTTQGLFFKAVGAVKGDLMKSEF